MEPVIFPKTLAPLIQPDRVKRTKSRGDSGKGSSFSNQMRQEKEASSDSQSPPREDSEFSPAAFAAGERATPSERSLFPQEERGPLVGKKLIDVRV
jgi:hypothetical protein